MKSRNLFFVIISISVFALLLSNCQYMNQDSGREVVKGYVDPDTLNTGLPIIKINTPLGIPIVSKEDYITANIQITDPKNAAYNLQTQTEIRGRGNDTWIYQKKPYRLKFFEKQSLFGLQKAKSWVLLANYHDRTLIMNTIAFELGRRLGLPYTNHYVHVELVLNGVYEGSYVLTEQVQVGKGRVDIDEDKGFLVEFDTYYDEEPKFKTTNYQLPVMIKSPEDLPNSSGYDFVKNRINALDNALFNDAAFSSKAHQGLIEMDTFVDFLLINEIVGNGEVGFPKSTYMYQDKDKKMSMGPLWDFDLGYGYSAEEGRHFVLNDSRNNIHPFFKRLFADSDFTGKYKKHWNDNYGQIASMSNFIDEMARKLELSQQANYKVWQWNDGESFASQIQKLKTWWNRRVAYLNREINK